MKILLKSPPSRALRVNSTGFSLIELMIVVGLLAIITSIALPSYQRNVLKTRRAEAFGQLLRLQSSYETYYSQNNTYLPIISIPNTANYSYSSSVTANTYTLTATALGSQTLDAEGGTSCSTVTLNNLGTQTPAACWPS